MAKVAGLCHFSYFLNPLYLLYSTLSALSQSIPIYLLYPNLSALSHLFPLSLPPANLHPLPRQIHIAFYPHRYCLHTLRLIRGNFRSLHRPLADNNETLCMVYNDINTTTIVSNSVETLLPLHFMDRKTPFSDCKTPFSDCKTPFYYLRFRKCLTPVNNSSRHAPNHNLFELTEVELP